MVHQHNAELTFGDLLIEALHRFPHRDAFVLGDRRVSYAEAAAVISRITQALSTKGISRGSAVAALSPNVPEVWLSQVATYLLGGTYTGLHPLGSAEDHAITCADAGIDVLLAHPSYADTAAAVAQQCPGIKHVLSIGSSELGPDLLALSADFTARPLHPGPAHEHDTAWLQYTGGTTGKPKGVLIPHRALVAMSRILTLSWGLPQNPRFLLSAPITHAGSLPILPTLCRGGTVVLQQSFDPDAWLATVAAENINYAFAVPTMVYALLDHGNIQRHNTSSLETLLYGAAPMTPARIAEAWHAFGPILMQGYGQTECLGMCTSLRKDEHDPERRPELLASCGRPVTDTRVAILDDTGEILPHGEVGELCLRSPTVMNGYHHQPEQTATALHNGWLHTGDLAVRDENGYYFIVDRTKDMIISGGFNIYPREIEDVIATIPGVSATAVIGLPDNKWGEAVTGFVVARPGHTIDIDNVLAIVRARKGPHQVPKAIHIVTELPLTTAGKIDKKTLRDQHLPTSSRAAFR
ncbi:fatty-acyl-CoA synthase [Nocardia sp. GAS34]|uniref:AMP-binding protein n=1 Tax=unclassified Nocardia TaxID=2637762 RepID=UPI003D247C1B